MHCPFYKQENQSLKIGSHLLKVTELEGDRFKCEHSVLANRICELSPRPQDRERARGAWPGVPQFAPSDFRIRGQTTILYVSSRGDSRDWRWR